MSIQTIFEDSTANAPLRHLREVNELLRFITNRRNFLRTKHPTGKDEMEIGYAQKALTFVAIPLTGDKAKATAPLDHDVVNEFDSALKRSDQVVCHVGFHPGSSFLKVEIMCFNERFEPDYQATLIIDKENRVFVQ